MKLSLKNALVGGLALSVVAVAIVAGGGSSPASATSFNKTAESFNFNASTRFCNALHPAIGTPTDHSCGAETLGAGGVATRSRNEVEDGSVLATGVQQMTWVSGGLTTACGANGNIVGTVESDVDLLRDGIVDQLANTDIVVDSTPPGFVAQVFPTPPSFTQSCYAAANIAGLKFGGGPTVALPNPVTLSVVSLDPAFAPAGTSLTAAFLGGDPNPPSSPLITIQNPQRATTNSCAAPVAPQGVGGIYPNGCDFASYTNTIGTNVVLWTLATGGADTKDGFSQTGPTGGTHEASGTAVPAGTLRNVQCYDNGGPACPVGALLWTDTDVDGLPDIVETGYGSSSADPDTDNDGLNDFEEMVSLTDPTDMDSDGDNPGGGVGARSDAVDNCPNLSQLVTDNPPAGVGIEDVFTQLDTDGDTIGDACDSDDDNDGLLDGAEAAKLYMAFADPDALTPGEQGGWNCRPSSDPGVPGAILITTNPLVKDTDGDGIDDGRECELGSAPGYSAAAPGVGFIAICVAGGAPTFVGCTTGTLNPTAYGSPVNAGAPVVGTSRPELVGDTIDNDLDGLVDEAAGANFGDADSDGLPNWAEVALGTQCARIIGGYGLVPAGCLDARFNNDSDGDAVPGLFDTNSDNSLACGGWTSAAGYPIPVGAIGCDGPEYFTSGEPNNPNEDGDGLSVGIKSTNATRGSAALTGFGFLVDNAPISFPVFGPEDERRGGCSAAEEAANGTSDSNPRDFRDVNASGNVDASDVSAVKGGAGSVSGDGTGRYKRTLDLNAAAVGGGKGSGNIDASDVSAVKGQASKTCASAP